MEHLRAFGINYFGSLGGSLIWLTNTPTVVTSHINNKCLTVTNPDHESVEHGVKQNHMCPDSKWDLTRPRVPLFNHRAAGLWAPTTAPPLITCKEFMKSPVLRAVLRQKCLYATVNSEKATHWKIQRRLTKRAESTLGRCVLARFKEKRSVLHADNTDTHAQESPLTGGFIPQFQLPTVKHALRLLNVKFQILWERETTFT